MRESKHEGDLSRLPRWARVEIERLRQNVASLERQVFEVANVNPGDTNTLVEEGMERHGLPEDAHIEFILKPATSPRDMASAVHAHIEHFQGRSWLVVTGYGPRGTIKILPRAANVVWVTCEDH